MSTSDQPETAVDPNEEARMAETWETIVQQEIDELRYRLTQRETALIRAPANLRRMTRATARLLGVYF